MTADDDLANELGAAVLEVPCPYKNCPAGTGSRCRIKSVYAMNEYGLKERVKGGNVARHVHYVRYRRAKAEGVID